MKGTASLEMPPVTSAGAARRTVPHTSSPAVEDWVSRDPASSTFQPAWSTAAPSARASAPASTLGVQRLLHRLRLRSLDVGLLLVLLVLLVVHRLVVDRPDVVVGAVHEVVHVAHGREHRVVGVVVAMQSVPADLDVVVQSVQPGAHH